MSTGIPRREFLKTVPGATVVVTQALRGTDLFAAPAAASIRIEPFHYRGVRLRPSRWQAQSDTARDVYAGF